MGVEFEMRYISDKWEDNMNKTSVYKTLTTIILMTAVIMMPISVSALSQEAQICRDLGIILGGDEGVNDAYMSSRCTRLQGAIMLLRLMQLEDTAFAYTRGDDFTDTSDYGWVQGRNLMRYLKDNSGVGFSGYPDGTFKPSDPFTAQQYYKVLLEVLGYQANIDYTWNEVFDLSASLGFSSIHNVDVLTMEDVAKATVEALKIKSKGDSRTLSEKLVDDNVISESIAVQYGLLEGESIVTPTVSGPLQPQDITYLGAFRLPDESEEHGWLWSGEAIAFNSSRDGGRGSLFGIGHNHLTQVSEITIPTPVISKSIGKLSYASTLQPFNEIRGSLFGSRYFEIPRVGLEVLNSKLYFCWGDHMQDEGNQPTHGYASMQLTSPNSKGLWSVGGSDYNYSTNDYMFKVPKSWSDQYASGYDMATGRFRDGGWGGMGPSLILFQTNSMASGQTITAKDVIRYTDISNYSGTTHTINNYSEADSWTGGAWVDSSAGGAVIFAGTHGYGSSWYGFSNGVVYPTDGNGPFPEMPPYPYDERGWWNSDFRATMMFYSPDVLGKVALNQMSAYDSQPYALLDLSQYMLVDRDETVMQYLGGMAYDDINQRLLVMELHADGDKPVVHVFSLGD